MDELQMFRPLLADAIGKFRFGTAAFVLNYLSNGRAPQSTVNAAFVKHLANIYDNFHILLTSIDSGIGDLCSLSVPPLPASLVVSDLERAYFDEEHARFKEYILSIGTEASSEAAALLLKSYYCLCNGYNLGALILFSRSLSAIIEIDGGFKGADAVYAAVNSYVSSSFLLNDNIPQSNFSFYVEYDRARIWIRDQYKIDIYELQRGITPNFRFGGM